MVEIMLEKMYNDGYLLRDIEIQPVQYVFSDVTTKKVLKYKISFDGILFVEDGGYVKLKQKELEHSHIALLNNKFQNRQERILKIYRFGLQLLRL